MTGNVGRLKYWRAIYPTRCSVFFRSQHNNQSWLGALTAILDATALVIVGVDSIRSEQAKITFAMSRHAIVDLAQIVNARYDPHFQDRLPAADLTRLQAKLAERGVVLRTGTAAEDKLNYLRSRYEPYAQSLAKPAGDQSSAVDSSRTRRKITGRSVRGTARFRQKG